MLHYIWDIYGMYWLGMLIGYLMCRWVHRDKITVGTPSASHNTRIVKICPSCKTRIFHGDVVRTCSQCGAEWDESGKLRNA